MRVKLQDGGAVEGDARGHVGNDARLYPIEAALYAICADKRAGE